MSMTRDLDRLAASTFDVVVIGGGITGLTIAYDAAQRGLSTALVERDDFGSGASFNHLRTIHGGLRYLQSMDLARARESVRERRTIARIAPHTIRPLAFAVPLYRSFTRGKLAMHAGFIVDRVVAFGRNRDVPLTHRLAAGRVVGRGTAVQRFPGLKRQGLTGAAVFYDYVTLEPDRLTFSFALAAINHGAALANHVDAVAPVLEGRRVRGVRVRDVLSGREFEVRARTVVNAAGGAIDRVLQPLGLSTGIPMLKAMNLITRRDAGDEALGGRTASGRHLFLVPWRERALFGTWESARPVDPSDDGVHAQDVTAFMQELNSAFPALDLSLSDVTFVHRGIVPAVVHDGRAALQGHDQMREHSADGADGLITVSAAKFTTARAVAERVTDRLVGKLQRGAGRCRTADVPLPGGDIADVGVAIGAARRDHDAGLPADAIPHLIAAYGSRYRDVLDLADGRADLRTRIAPDSPVIGAELVHAVRREMAITLADAVLRRTPLGAVGYPGAAALERAAAIVGAELNWPLERQRAEIAAMQSVYAITES